MPQLAPELQKKDLRFPELREYQKKQVNETIATLSGDIRRVMLQQPTGGGKSVIFAWFVVAALMRGQRVLIVVHKVELLRQALDHIEQWTGQRPGAIANKSQFPREPDKQVQVCSIQAWSRLKKKPEANLVIIDEAHHAAAPSYTKLFIHYEKQIILGFTATPTRLDGRGLRWLHNGVSGFQALILGASTESLMADGFLCPVKIYSPQHILDPEAAGIPKSKGDYKRKELEEYTETVMLSGDVYETWKKLAEGKQTVVYPVSVKLSLEYCETFIDNGVAAAHIDANTPAKEREQILADFAAGIITVLFQHSIVIEGVNIVGIEVVVFARPTFSVVTWFQAIGRSRRPAPGKEWSLIIDHTATHALLPHPDDEIPWSLDAISLAQQGFGTLQCPECGHIYKMSQPERDRGWSHCAGCQAKFSFEVQRGPGGRPRTKTVQTLPADFNELSLYQLDKPTMEFFEEKQEEEKSRGYKSGWAAFKTVDACKEGKFAGGLQEFKEIAIRTGFKPGWGYYKWREVQEWRFQ